MATQPKHLFTPDEYLALERQADYRSEYAQGEISAISGASLPHNRISRNMLVELDLLLRETTCEAFANDLRIYAPATGMFTYPDVVVVCGAPQFLDNQFDTLLNPTLVVEVLSPTTEAYDRGRKFENYRALSSLQQYVLIATDRISVDVFTRKPEDRWDFIAVTDSAGSLDLTSVHARVEVSVLYRGIRFDNPV